MSSARKRVVVILNGISRGKRRFYNDYLPAISGVVDVEVNETLSENDARSIASRCRERGVDAIFAAGGDGTLHQVINGLMGTCGLHGYLPAIGVLPMGSANDFSRALGIRQSAAQLSALLAAFTPRPVDVGEIEFSTRPDGGEKRSAYFINVADIGMGPEVVKKVLASRQRFGSQFAYYKSIINTFLTYKPVVVHAVAPEWVWKGRLRTLAVANGRYYGHGLCIAPDAVTDDGMFSVFICGNVSVLDFIAQTGKLRKGRKVVIDDVLYKTATTVALTSESPCAIEGDGEVLGWLPARVGLAPRQLQFLA